MYELQYKILHKKPIIWACEVLSLLWKILTSKCNSLQHHQTEFLACADAYRFVSVTRANLLQVFHITTRGPQCPKKQDITQSQEIRLKLCVCVCACVWLGLVYQAKAPGISVLRKMLWVIDWTTSCLQCLPNSRGSASLIFAFSIISYPVELFCSVISIICNAVLSVLSVLVVMQCCQC